MESTGPASATCADHGHADESAGGLCDGALDPRRTASVSYPLPAILALAVSALLCAHASVLAMAEWGARQLASLLACLGFTSGQTPCQSTLHRLFRQLDPVR